MDSYVVLITQEGLGHVESSEKQFGLEMLDRFLHVLEGRPAKPEAICLYTDGVKLVCEGSVVLLSLKLLQGMGVRLVACKTCLEHFGLANKVAAGGIAGMNEIVDILTQAGKVISV